ncbi:hypothetical protein F4780DRAFT_233344 [Xylariomycetidae sp. FL0641]|nr:hypothetical protein F4780DRAFT_233344 [Xylariomycetidae sp. FL0641]
MSLIIPRGTGLALFIVSVVLLSLSWLTVAARLAVRRTIKGIGLDDWTMLLGLLFFTLTCLATGFGTFHGIGAHADRISDDNDREGRMWFMCFQLFYVASTVPIKCSICVALIRLTTRRLYKHVLYGIMAFSTAAAGVTIVVVLAWCTPIAATWDKRLGSCGAPSVITDVSYYLSASSILTDWTCAILPAFIVWEVQLHSRVKVSVAIVLGLGIVASTATLVRLKFLLRYNNPDDYLWGIASIATWSIVESGTGIIAGSMPALRPLLRYIPFLGDSLYNSKKNGSKLPSSGDPKRGHQLDVFRAYESQLDTKCEGTRHKRRGNSDDDGSSQWAILPGLGGITVKNSILITEDLPFSER